MKSKNLLPAKLFFLFLIFQFADLKMKAQICVTPAVDYTTSGNPNALVNADFDGDGKKDLAVANYGSDNVSILLGNGTGGFGTATNFSVGDGPSDILCADFNEDGNPDLVTADFWSDAVSVFLGNGTGGFVADTIVSVGENPVSIIGADFNADGNIDIGVCNYQSGDVSILLGNGLGDFTVTQFTSIFYNRAIAAADFDTDGNLDIAVADVSGNTGYIFLGDGTGNFTPGDVFSFSTIANSMHTSDFNADGKADLAVSGSSLCILLGDGAGGFGASNCFTTDNQDQNNNSMCMTDFNSDGKQDFIVPIQTGIDPGRVVILPGDGAGNFGPAAIFPVGQNAFDATSGDFNGDGKPDIATANYNVNKVSVLLNQDFIVTASASATTICAGALLTLTGGGATSYKWTGGVTNGQPFAAPATSTTYTVTGTDDGCSNKASISITVNPVPVATLSKHNETSSLYCDGSIKAFVTGGTGTIQMEWTDAAQTILSTTDSVWALCTGMYALHLEDANGCENMYTDSIYPGPVPAVPPLCVVTVDTALSHNVVVWEKTNLNMIGIDSFIVYREISTSNYQPIGTVPADSLSTFDDSLANPSVTGYRYKLKSKNSMGVLSAFSPYHNTIYLVNTNGNFNWTPYQIEGNTSPVSNYNVYRDNSSTGSFILIGNTTGNQFGFTDTQFPLFPNASYYVEAVMTSGPCSPTRSDFSVARSNVKRFGIINGIDQWSNPVINIYPNPADNAFAITGISGKTTLQVYDVIGKLVLEKETDSNTTLNTSQLEEGIFTLITTTKTGRTYNKVIVRH
jgi:hypothetical protein